MRRELEYRSVDRQEAYVSQVNSKVRKMDLPESEVKGGPCKNLLEFSDTFITQENLSKEFEWIDPS